MSESTSSQSQQTQQADNRIVMGQGALLAQGGSSITINSLDAEVANAAINASTKDLKLSFDFGKSALDFAAKSQNSALDSLHSEAVLVSNAYADAKGRGALTDKILIGAIAMAGLVAVAALRTK